MKIKQTRSNNNNNKSRQNRKEIITKTNQEIITMPNLDRKDSNQTITMSNLDQKDLDKIITNLDESDQNIFETFQLVMLEGFKCQFCRFLSTDKLLLQSHSDEKHPEIVSKTFLNKKPKTFDSETSEKDHGTSNVLEKLKGSQR